MKAETETQTHIILDDENCLSESWQKQREKERKKDLIMRKREEQGKSRCREVRAAEAGKREQGGKWSGRAAEAGKQ